jgi:hypothetical protein
VPTALAQPTLVAVTILSPVVVQVTVTELLLAAPEMKPPDVFQFQPPAVGLQTAAVAVKVRAWLVWPTLGPPTKI